MRNPWVGLELGVDPVGLARALIGARNRSHAGETVTGLRDVVTDSWSRARVAGVDPERHHVRRAYDAGEVDDRWAAHPLHRFAPLIEKLLCDFAYDSRHIVVLADAKGCLLWTSGHPGVLSASEKISFTPGHDWSECRVGTNGVGTAIAVDHPVQIFSAEHFNLKIDAWTCSGAPIHDPESGDLLGVVDVSSGIRAAHPHSLALVSAAADAVESILRGELEQRRAQLRAEFYERAARWRAKRSALVDRTGQVLACHPPAWLTGPLVRAGQDRWLAPGSDEILVAEALAGGAGIVVEGEFAAGGRPPLTVQALGRSEAKVDVGGMELTLSPRRSELLVLLAMHPEGLTAEQLATELFGDAEKVMSARVEVSRLRRQLVGLVATRPYRLLAEVEADFLADPALHDGVLLPGATSPTVVAERARLTAASAN